MGKCLALIYVIAIISKSHSYVVLTGNLEDFKTLAKKIVPEKLALQLAKLASATSVNDGQLDSEESEADYESSEQEQVAVSSSTSKRNKLKLATKNYEPSKIDFEYLVEQIKQRLHSDMVKRTPSPEKNIAPKYIDQSGDSVISKTNLQSGLDYFREIDNQDKLPRKSHVKNTNKQDEILSNNKQHKKERIHAVTKETKGNQKAGRNENYYEENIATESNKPYVKDEGKMFSETELHSYSYEDYRMKQDRKTYKTANGYVENPIVNSEKGRHREIPFQKTSENTMQYNLQTKLKPREKTKVDKNRNIKAYKDISEDDYNMPFKKIKISHVNDSYEDYVIPKRDQDIYENHKVSKGTNKTGSVIDNPPSKTVDEYDINNYHEHPKAKTETLWFDDIVSVNDKDKYDQEDETPANHKKVAIKTGYVTDITLSKTVHDYDRNDDHEENEPKAKTESLWFDDQVSDSNNDNYKKKDITPAIHKTGTNIPKRDFYKMSSPNYLEKVPVIAEKYNFQEPVPENDRVQEKFQSIKGLVPLKINGRVKLN